jgi:hypothetical protein
VNEDDDAEGADAVLERLSLDRRTVEVAEETLRVQKRQVWIQAGAAVLPMMALIGTIAYGSWALQRQADEQFRLEIAKAIIQAPNPNNAVGRAAFYAKVFPGRMPPNLASKVSVDEYSSDVDSRLDFLKTVADRGLTPEETARLWTVLFSDEFARGPEVAAFFEKRAPSSGERARGH